MTMFWVIAVLLLLAAIGALLYPVLRARSESPRYLTVFVTALGVPALALGLYLSIGQWQSPEIPATAAGQQDLEVVTSALADRLRKQGGTLDEWMMLGKTYTVVGRYGEAAAAYAEAREIAGESNLDVLAYYAEALILADQNQLMGEAGQMFEQILADRPDDTRALWYGGLVAFGKSQYELAVVRWQQLLGQSPPDNLRPILEQRISDAQLRLGADVPPQPEAQAASVSTAVPGTATSPEPVSSTASAAVVPAQAVIRVSVSADPGLISTLAPNTPIFVLARGATPGPPLAARRMSVGDLPFTLELSDSDAMVAGRNLSSSSRVEIIARVALGGTPVAQAGDLFGGLELDVTDDMPPVEITISKRIE